MRGVRDLVAVALLVGACVSARAQTRKAGLWELTVTTTFQQSPLPGTMPAPLPQTQNVCLTQAMIDRYGAILPAMRNSCHVTKVVLKPGGMTGEMMCTGAMSGKAALDSSSADGLHAVGSVHFVGTMKAGAAGMKPVEWTSKSSSVFKSADCGAVKPAQLP